MKSNVVVSVAMLSAVLAARCPMLALAADFYDAFQSPSGNVACGIGFLNNNGSLPDSASQAAHT